ncbi:MAG: hybrid sensor histidine kinase/response regulator [Gammaproteobacteria bacterium]
MANGPKDFGSFSMLDLFRIEAAAQMRVLDAGLLNLEQNAGDADQLEQLMRAAHSLKGAARMVDLDSGVRIAHCLEDYFVAAQQGTLRLGADHIDVLLKAVDYLKKLSATAASEMSAWQAATQDQLNTLLEALTQMQQSPSTDSVAAPRAIATPPAAAPFDPAAASMLELFRNEVEGQAAVLAQDLLELEQNPQAMDRLERLMRAAHSIKGAARMVNIEGGVKIAHAMEDCFVAAQAGAITLQPASIDRLLLGVDTLTEIAQSSAQSHSTWLQANQSTLDTLLDAFAAIKADQSIPASTDAPAIPAPIETPIAPSSSTSTPTLVATDKTSVRDHVVRVSADSLNRLMGLSGEALVGARWLRPYAESLLQVKRRQAELITVLDHLWDIVGGPHLNEYAASLFKDARRKASDCRLVLSDRLTDLEEYDRRTSNLSSRLNREVIASRMRPFADGVHGFQRMVRDLARQLGKDVRLEIRGLNTQVDRDILEKIEAPLNHLLRNALDHGVDSPEQRRAAGKPAQATIVLEALHTSGMLSISVSDDGRGVDLDTLREKIIQKGLVTADTAPQLSDTELLEFLFLPSFSTRDQVTETSGRGVGLDVVHSVMQEMRGVIRTTTQMGKGTRFQMQLPLTLSVIRALLVEIAGEVYAFPLARIDHTLKLDKAAIELVESRQYFTANGQHISIVTANQVLELDDAPHDNEVLSVIVIGDRNHRFGLIVDRFMGERNLVVRTLDPRLGKIRDISAAAFMEDGTPTLIVDVDDLLRSIEILVNGGRLDKVRGSDDRAESRRVKRVLVVDDSITIREVERNMLQTRGYEVDVAVDGMDGWNAVRTGHYDLVISDIDMPRMNGIEFVGHIKKDPRLKHVPVMIVSYKDREEDRNRGLEAGADYYITKGSFHDETLLDAVADLIGGA